MVVGSCGGDSVGVVDVGGVGVFAVIRCVDDVVGSGSGGGGIVVMVAVLVLVIVLAVVVWVVGFPSDVFCRLRRAAWTSGASLAGL